MLSLDKYMNDDKNRAFIKRLNISKKRAFSVATFKESSIDAEKGLLSEALHKKVIDKYAVAEAEGEYLSMKVKKFY